MKNNNTLPEKIDGFYFWNGDVTFEVSTEAAKRWNNYTALVESLKEAETRFNIAAAYHQSNMYSDYAKKINTLLKTLDSK